jgi:CRISPR-associated protein Cas1
MFGRVVEIADDERHLAIDHGLLVVSDQLQGRREPLGSVPLDDIGAVIVHARGVTYNHSVLIAFAERGIPLVICGLKHLPVGLLLGLDTHHRQAHRFEAQVAASLPTRKRLWASLVRAKIAQQAAVLNAIGLRGSAVGTLAADVRSGDPENREAQAARRYWPLIFGADFRRDRMASGINSLLNYGYTVARAGMARGVMAAGLHPSFGLHHSHDENAMRLVDDLMEPFRPLVDLAVWQLVQEGHLEVTTETKRSLVHSFYRDLETEVGATPVFVAMQRVATSLVQVYDGERDRLDLPPAGIPRSYFRGLDE